MVLVQKNNLSTLLIIAFAIVSLIEIIAEFYSNKQLLWLFKPLLMPLLLVYYLKTAKKVNVVFVVSLFFSWIANMFFIERDFDSIILGSIFFLIYRSLIIYHVFKTVKMPSQVPFILGIIPFLFIYITTCLLNYEAMGKEIILFIIHGIFVIILGGYSLGNYIINAKKSDMFLFVSTFLFAFSQFIFVFRVYTEMDYLLQSVVMLMFVFAQYFLVRFIIIQEEYNLNYSVSTNSR
jgi:hypothetical protein